MFGSISWTMSRSGGASAAASPLDAMTSVLRDAEILPLRHVEPRRGPLSDPVVLAVCRDPDDFGPGLPFAIDEANPFADGILPGPVARGHRLVDQHDARRVRGVASLDAAACDDRDRHRVEIAFVDPSREHDEALGARRQLKAFGDDGHRVASVLVQTASRTSCRRR